MRVWQKALHRENWHRWFAWYPVEARDSLVWLKWIERRRCYAVIDEWWEVRLPHLEEAERQAAAHTTGSERREALAVCAENSYAAGECDGADREVQVPQDLLGQDRAAARGGGEAILVPLSARSPEAALA
jgi:hypothetical protein